MRACAITTPAMPSTEIAYAGVTVRGNGRKGCPVSTRDAVVLLTPVVNVGASPTSMRPPSIWIRLVLVSI
jgi:hypothetical protein